MTSYLRHLPVLIIFAAAVALHVVAWRWGVRAAGARAAWARKVLVSLAAGSGAAPSGSASAPPGGESPPGVAARRPSCASRVPHIP